MIAKKNLGREVHRIEVEPIAHEPRIPELERGTGFLLEHAILVDARSSVAAGIEIGSNFVRAANRDIGRQQRIHRALQINRGERFRQIEGGHLSAGMHTGVGASRTMNPDICAEDFRECGFESGLDRILAGL